MRPICRICNAELVSPILSLMDMPLTEEFIEISKQNSKEYIGNIDIFCCDKCGITQNPTNFVYKQLYSGYRYSTGKSDFTNQFMKLYAEETFNSFVEVNGCNPESVLEIGSGDGQQLKKFIPLGVKSLLGIEPSEYLSKAARDKGIETITAVFDKTIESIPPQIDILLSSYTFDHVERPLDYLSTAHGLLVDGGILAIEIHNYDDIVDRAEYCLFEHEHTIYLNAGDLRKLLEQSGFSIISINPINQEFTRGNSLIAIAKKNGKSKLDFSTHVQIRREEHINIKESIKSIIDRIDSWIELLPKSSTLVGYGAGGRGVMTTAALSQYGSIKALLDSNFVSNKYLTPKTRIPVVGPDNWSQYKDAYCIVFSYGYYQEISQNLTKVGFNKERIISLRNFMPIK